MLSELELNFRLSSYHSGLSRSLAWTSCMCICTICMKSQLNTNRIFDEIRTFDYSRDWIGRRVAEPRWPPWSGWRFDSLRWAALKSVGSIVFAFGFQVILGLAASTSSWCLRIWLSGNFGPGRVDYSCLLFFGNLGHLRLQGATLKWWKYYKNYHFPYFLLLFLPPQRFTRLLLLVPCLANQSI